MMFVWLILSQHETSSSALSWMAYCLCKDPELQQKVREEIRTNIPSANADIDATTLESLPYLNAVISEVLRLYPVAPFTMRQAVRDTTVMGYNIPKGTWFSLVMYATNRDVKLWGPDAEFFRPERWIDVDEKTGEKRTNHHGGASSNYAMLTFLHGPRSCIGQGFARAELRCAIAGLVGRFLLELQRPDEEVVGAGIVTVKPKGGMHLKMTVLDGW